MVERNKNSLLRILFDVRNESEEMTVLQSAVD
jgi:hypothetical protein